MTPEQLERLADLSAQLHDHLRSTCHDLQRAAPEALGPAAARLQKKLAEPLEELHGWARPPADRPPSS